MPLCPSATAYRLTPEEKDLLPVTMDTSCRSRSRAEGRQQGPSKCDAGREGRAVAVHQVDLWYLLPYLCFTGLCEAHMPRGAEAAGRRVASQALNNRGGPFHGGPRFHAPGSMQVVGSNSACERRWSPLGTLGSRCFSGMCQPRSGIWMDGRAGRVRVRVMTGRPAGTSFGGRQKEAGLWHVGWAPVQRARCGVVCDLQQAQFAVWEAPRCIMSRELSGFFIKLATPACKLLVRAARCLIPAFC